MAQGDNTFFYNPAMNRILTGQLDAGSITWKALLVRNLNDARIYEFVADLLSDGYDEYDGGGYSRPTLTGITIEVDDVNNRIEIHCDSPIEFGSVSAGTAPGASMVVFYSFVTDDTDSVLVFQYDNALDFPFNGAGGPVTMLVDAQGLAWLRNMIPCP